MANAQGFGNVFTSCFDEPIQFDLTPGRYISPGCCAEFRVQCSDGTGRILYYRTQAGGLPVMTAATDGRANDPNNAIAVVVVGVGQTNITASTTATDLSTQGIYRSRCRAASFTTRTIRLRCGTET